MMSQIEQQKVVVAPQKSIANVFINEDLHEQIIGFAFQAYSVFGL